MLRPTVIQGALDKAFGTIGGYVADSPRSFDFSAQPSTRLHLYDFTATSLAAEAPAAIGHLKASQAQRDRHQEGAVKLNASSPRPAFAKDCGSRATLAFTDRAGFLTARSYRRRRGRG